MGYLRELYGTPLALLTDLYELTMGDAYWQNGMAEHEAVFHMAFRRVPFGGGVGLACGLGTVVEYLEDFRFTPEDIAYLRTLEGHGGKPLFSKGFLDWLSGMELSIDLDAIPEGTPVFPNEPLVRVQGPLIQAQILESAVLNIVAFQTLIATKAARVCAAAEGAPVLEFGLRRSQGIDGAMAAARAAYVGGVAATSNVLAGRLLGIPVRGTHAHSWVMSFESEGESFDAWGRAMPHNSIFLVDTYSTVKGMERAIAAGRRLAEAGHHWQGIRLDSGDLAELGHTARRMLDEAGFADVKIVGSGDLDEFGIADLKSQGAPIALWGVGTRLVTAEGEPSLTSAYKLALIRPPGGEWRYCVKVSDDPEKTSTPGMLQVRRFTREGQYTIDAIYDELPGMDKEAMVVPFGGGGEPQPVPGDAAAEDLLVPVLRGGRRVGEIPGLEESRRLAAECLERVPEQVRRLESPASYPVGLEQNLHRKKREAMAKESSRK